MTISACYLSPEGVVLGADSTSTMFVSGRGHQVGSEHYYNFAQKIFEMGQPGSAIGATFWGLGSLGETSQRTLVAETSQMYLTEGLDDIKGVATMMACLFWEHYKEAFGDQLSLVKELQKNKERSESEQQDLVFWQHILSGGFCVAGRYGKSLEPRAFEITYGPELTEPPEVAELSMGVPKFWGCPNLIERLTIGMDFALFSRIVGSDKWTGTADDLFALVEEGALGQPLNLPLREAIDWIYASVYTTIKAMKFSHLAPVCGGPVEIAVITSDRPFRWVKHKQLGEAISVYDMQEPRK